MNLFRKTTATVALVALVSGIFSTGVSAYSTAEVDAANELAAAGVINNHSADPAGYNLDQNVLRQEIAAVARGVAGLDKATTCNGSFADVSATTPNDWACLSVEPLLDNGLIAANENFRPEANITKAEAIGMMVKAAFGDEYMYDSSKGTSWQEQVVEFASMNGVTAEFTNYNTLATRGFVFEAGANAMTSSVEESEDDILSDLLEGLLDEEDTTSEDDNSNNEDENNNEEDEVVVTPSYGTDVEVTLNPMSAESQTVPNSGLVTFAKFDITAGSEDAAISSIQLERSGLSNRSDIDRVYFEQNSKRISSRGSVNIDDEVMVSFTPAMVVEAGTTETIDLVVQLDGPATVGAEHRFALVDVESTTNVANNLPVVTNTMKLGSYTVEEVTFRATDTGTELNVGDSDVTIGEFELQTTGNEDNLFKSVTFTNNGGADLESVFANIGLYNDGVNVASEILVDGRDITFIVNHEIENGRTELYEIRADFISTEREEDTVELELRNTTDLNVVELDTEFSAPIVATDDTMGEYTLKGGELLLTRDTEYTNTDTVSASTNDVVLMAANLKVDEAITVEDLNLDYTTTVASLETQYRDLKLVVDGRTISTYTPETSGDDANTGTGNITFDGTFLVENDSSVMILGNLQNNIDNNATFVLQNFVLNSTTTEDMRYVSNDEEVTSIPGSVQSVKVTVAEAELLVTRNDGLSSEDLVSGARDVELFGFSMRANDVADIKVTSLTPSLLTTDVDLQDITNVRLYEGNTLLQTENDFDFNSLNVVIAKNTAKSFRIVADFNTSVADNSVFQLGLAASNIDARNQESNRLLGADSITGTNSSVFTFADEGELTVSVNSSTRSSSVVAPSDSEVDVFTFDLKATDDDLRVTDLYVTNVAGSVVADAEAEVSTVTWAINDVDDFATAISAATWATSDSKLISEIESIEESDLTVTSSNTWAAVKAAIEAIELNSDNFSTISDNTLDLANSVRSVSVNIGGRTIDGAVVDSNVLYFPVWSSNPLVLTRDETVQAEVSLSFNDSNTRKSKQFTLTIGSDTYTPVNGTVNGMRILSDSTGQELNGFTGTATSNTHLYARSLPVVTDGAAQRNEQKFSISADSNRKVTVKELTVDVNVSSATLSDTNVNQLSLYAGNNVVTEASFALSGTTLTISNLTEEVSAGSTQEFEIRNLDQIISNTTSDSSRTMRVFGVDYTADINDATDIITVDNSASNEYVNTGIPTTGTTFNNY